MSKKKPKGEIKSSELIEKKEKLWKKTFFEKEEGGSRASSDSEGEIFSSSSAAEGERENLHLIAIEPLKLGERGNTIELLRSCQVLCRIIRSLV